MAKDFISDPIKPYIGAPYSAPIDLCKPSSLPPASVPFSIPWEIYGAGDVASGHLPNVGVTVNLQNMGSNKAILDVVRGVYVDNLGCDVPVYVYFPETNFTVAAQPNATMFFPVFANAKTAIIYGQGFTEANKSARTIVLFTNVSVSPYVDNELLQNVALYKASPTIQRGSNIFNSIYAPAALGDQVFSVSIPLSFGSTSNMFPSQQASGFYYVKSLYCNVIDPRCVGPGIDLQVILKSLDVSGDLIISNCIMNTTATPTLIPINVINMQNMQLKLDASERWRLTFSGASLSGVIQLINCFTYNPK